MPCKDISTRSSSFLVVSSVTRIGLDLKKLLCSLFKHRTQALHPSQGQTGRVPSSDCWRTLKASNRTPSRRTLLGLRRFPCARRLLFLFYGCVKPLQQQLLQLLNVADP